MSGVLKLGNVTLGTENNGKIDLTNVGAASATTMSTSSFTSDPPLFRVGLNSKYTLAHYTTVKFPADNVIYDTHSRYNYTSSISNGIPAYSYMPTVAGYYNFTANITTGFQDETVGYMINIKRHSDIPETSSFTYVSYMTIAPTGSTSWGVTSNLASGLIYMNGTTHYVNCELSYYNYTDAGTDTTEQVFSNSSFFQGFLIRK